MADDLHPHSYISWFLSVTVFVFVARFVVDGMKPLHQLADLLLELRQVSGSNFETAHTSAATGYVCMNVERQLLG